MKRQTGFAPVRFGSPRSLVSADGSQLELALPVLAGTPIVRLPIEAGDVVQKGAWRIWNSDTWLCAQGLTRVTGSPAPVARRLYREAFEIADDLHLYRFWNFVPQINGKTDGLENYRSFVLGRHEAFSERFGRSASSRMPAATGVGLDDDSLVVCFLAGRTEPAHFENPNQVPAYQYPGDYGPRPPSFARGTRVSVSGSRLFFVAGTASVLGHTSVGSGDLRHQIDVTMKNLESLSVQMGLSSPLGKGQGYRRSFRIFLRNAGDIETAVGLLNAVLLEPGDEVVWLRSDICRRDLDIEIEATLIDRS